MNRPISENISGCSKINVTAAANTESKAQTYSPIELNQESEKDVYVFVHGFSSNYHDLLPIAHDYANQGHMCVLLRFPDALSMSTTISEESLSNWTNQVVDSVNEHISQGRRVFIVGFSFGATIALNAATKCEIGVAGVVAISAFFAPRMKRLSKLFQWLGRKFPLVELPRWKQTTAWRPIDMPDLLPQVQLFALDRVISKASDVQKKMHLIRCPVLFLHSIDDWLASYRATVEAVHRMAPEMAHLLTLRNQNHWLQFDMHPAAIRDVADAFFAMVTSRDENEEQYQDDILVEELSQGHQEIRHWGAVVLRIFVGFITLLSALLWSSFDIVHHGHLPQAPLFLSLYSFIGAGYIILISVYFFYMVRAEVYLKHHIEPICRGISWVTFRTTTAASGKISRHFTQYAAIPITVLPLIGSSIALGFSCIEYFSYWKDNPFLWIIPVFCGVFIVSAAFAASKLLLFAERELYGAWRPHKLTSPLSQAIQSLQSSILAASVRQPTEISNDKV